MSFSKEMQVPVEGENHFAVSKVVSENIRQIKQCKNDGFVKISLPITILAGVSNYFGIKSGIIPKAKCGLLYQVFSTVMTTFIAVETTYSAICIYKHYPDYKNSNQLMLNEIKHSSKVHEKLNSYGAIVDTLHDDDNATWDVEEINTKELDTKELDTYADVNFLNEVDSTYPDTYIKDYDQDIPVRSYTTYDELRIKNRERYKQVENTSQRNLNMQKTTFSLTDKIDKKQTKYGDVWDE